MKNKEFYKEKIYEVACKHDAFAVNKKTGEVTNCGNITCSKCLFETFSKCLFDSSTGFRAGDTCNDRAREWLEQEHIEPVLDDVEKRYLEGVIRPFKKRIKSIQKLSWSNAYAYIWIVMDWLDDSECEYLNLPLFVGNKMYKGMVLGKQYTLEELGLFK